MDAMTQKLDKLNVNAVNSCAPSPCCDRCGSLDHITENCQVENPFAPPPVEHAAYVNNFQPRPYHNPYFNSYNPGWKQHPNFSYRTKPLSFPRPMLGLDPLLWGTLVLKKDLKPETLRWFLLLHQFDFEVVDK